MSADRSQILISDWGKISHKNQSEIYCLIQLSGKKRKRIKLPKRLRESKSISFLNNKRALSQLKDDELCLWDLESRKDVRQLGDNRKSVCFKLLDDQRSILGVSLDGDLFKWNCFSGKYQHMANIDEPDIYDLQPVPNSYLILFISANKTLNLFDWENSIRLATFSVQSEISVYQLVASQNLIVLGETSGKIHFLKIEI